MKLFVKIGIAFTATCLVQIAAGQTPTNEQKMANFEQSIDAPRVGKIRLSYVYDEDNEPVSQPASFKIFIQCEHRRTEVLVEDVRACELKSYKYVKEDKILHAEIIYPVMDGASIAHCERREEQTFDLGKFCDDHWANRSKKGAKSKRPHSRE